ncbi:IS3 family transposase [Ruminococcus albus]|uniref:HTH-like domain-containing protein n=1 Tax=Ruminococcus albus TaxID=1264 RepID=A0A1I1CV05_RUMAL|nr:IS3 family transposase [Ruminococcus albus]SFB66549.1 HTH-like domain-containing protein [Ruminococcus albus]
MTTRVIIPHFGKHRYAARKPAKDLELSELIRECQVETKQTYGYRRVAIWLERKGVHHNPKTILRIMNKYSLLSVVRRRRYCNYSQALHRYDNLLNRDFHSDRTNQKWVTQDFSGISVSLGDQRPL